MDSQVTYLELSEGREHKFYEVTVAGAVLTIRYGRIGTEGQSKTITAAAPAEATREATKKLAEKRRKGYADAVPGQTARKAVEKPRGRLHRTLEPYRAQIEATLKPVMFLTLHDSQPGPMGSMVGGTPYRRQGESWPAAPDGTPMTFLAQLNFAELPKLLGFPTSGLLQFFIGTNDLYGCDFMRPGRANPAVYEVRWIPQPVTDLFLLDDTTPDHAGEYSPLPAGRGMGITGELAEHPMSDRDRLFTQAIGIDFLDEGSSPDEDLSKGEWLEERYDEATLFGHQVGGHPTFTQEDPRLPDDPRVLLFQLDSDWQRGVMWGDSGIANFFIHPDDLARRDFSHVAYNWDCC
ncbi:DUF1963 domain-containing protein [Deinococcus soli (ex Cha et al. 2016)]|uniref:DUF1963 domain-containing protein n=1 Tax=Deinococcus soli (ex Cha et al. 2016) TaxID=1309411 RepID=UPI001662FAE7|nr:DUF1963 domain-containing protein [Deinococcus soli (ex Cha et al. 2016)]GGB73271.1 hypothetical protein GCM10008019_31850 [Deinococcus soli (ex Cha et al. 2016)]